MKKLLTILALGTSTLLAEDPTVEKKTAYVNEANLPQGWPMPGPYDQVSLKKYPEYRAAITEGGRRGSFWTLFRHIQKNDIPMTAPVEMEMSSEGQKMEQTSMAFLYQNAQVGKTGPHGKNIQVIDVPKTTALSYTWMGRDSPEKIAEARALLDAALQQKGKTALSYRMLGYNGPSTPRKKRTYELQAILPAE